MRDELLSIYEQIFILTKRDIGIKVPDDISVIGYDDLDAAQLVSPPLTTLGVEKEELGSLGVRMLLERIEKPDIPLFKTAISTELVVRKSCRRYNKGGKDYV